MVDILIPKKPVLYVPPHVIARQKRLEREFAIKDALATKYLEDKKKEVLNGAEYQRRTLMTDEERGRLAIDNLANALVREAHLRGEELGCEKARATVVAIARQVKREKSEDGK